MSVFTDAELSYMLAETRLARIATFGSTALHRSPQSAGT
jgi:hypothetical protein